MLGHHSIPVPTIYDTGSGAEALVDSTLVHAHELPIFALEQPVILVAVDDHEVQDRVTTYTEFSLEICQGRMRHIAPVRAFITNLGPRSLLLGRPWANEHDVAYRSTNNSVAFLHPRCHREHLHFSSSKTPLRERDSLQKMHSALADSLLSNPFAPSSSHPPTPTTVSAPLFDPDSLRCNLEALGCKFHPQDFEALLTSPSPPRTLSQSSMDIALVGAPAFLTHLRHYRSHQKVQCFASSLYDVNKALEKLRKTKTDVDLTQLPDWVNSENHIAFHPQEAEKLAPRRPYDHKIELLPGKNPPWGPLYKMSVGELEVLKEWLEQNLEKGWIRASQSPAAAPVLFAHKPGGGLRLCVDYRRLNEITKKNRYPIPLISETLERIKGCKFFTKLDVIAAFNRIRIAEGDEWKTAFRCRFGLFESLVMPFGLTNSPPTFQAYINDVLKEGLDKFVTAYIDDLLIFSRTRKEHRQQVNWVLRQLQAAGLQVDINKCEFERDEVHYLGMVIGRHGIRTDPAKVQAILQWPDLQSQKDVRSFLGFANFYRKFIKGFAARANPLTRLTKKDCTFQWTPTEKAAFEDLKNCFATAPTLAIFDPQRTCIFESDCSNTSLGCALSQYDDNGVLHPIAFYSRRLLPAEMNYPIHDKELLAIITGFEEWRPELSSADPNDPIRVFTDHSSLRYFMSTKRLTQRQVRWAEFLSQFHFQIQYRPGNLNHKADALSRWEADLPAHNDERLQFRDQTLLGPETLHPRVQQATSVTAVQHTDSQPTTVHCCLVPAIKLNNNLLFHCNRLPHSPPSQPQDHQRFVPVCPAQIEDADTTSTLEELFDQAYRTDPLPVTILQLLRDGARTSPYPFLSLSECSEHDGKLYIRNRRYVPDDRQLKSRILHLLHTAPTAGHPGKNKLYALVANEYFWNGMSRDIDTFIKNCHCIANKADRQKKQGLLKPLPIPQRLWGDLSLDFVTGLPPSRDLADRVCTNILVVVDRLSKGAIFIPMADMDVKPTVDALRDRVFAYHGLPDTMISDRGGQFIRALWKRLMQRIGIQSDKSSGYHPETDGQTENANGALEAYLRSYVSYHQDDWASILPEAMLSRSAHIAESTKFSPHFLTHGTAPRISFEIPQPLPSDAPRHAKLDSKQADAWADYMRDCIAEAREAMLLAQDKQQAYANQHRRPHPNYQPGDMVWVRQHNNLPQRRVSPKLSGKLEGPFRVLEPIGSHAYRIDSKTAGFDWHDVFHAAELYPAANDPFPGQTLRLRGPDSQSEWVVNQILDSLEVKRNKYRTDRYYVVDYDGHPPYRTHAWTIKEDLPEMVAEFHRKHPDRPGPWDWKQLRKPLPGETLGDPYTYS